jgi:hypothetical protein
MTPALTAAPADVALSELSECCPEVRLGQLIANLSYLAIGPSNQGIGEVEDEELLSAARRHLNRMRDNDAPAVCNVGPFSGNRPKC